MHRTHAFRARRARHRLRAACRRSCSPPRTARAPRSTCTARTSRRGVPRARRRPAVPERDVAVRGRAPRSAAACRCAFRNSPTRARCRCTASCARSRGTSSRPLARRTAPRMRGFASPIRPPRAHCGRTRSRCELDVTVGGHTLALELAVTNAGAAPFAFTGALHTYLARGRRARGPRARARRRALSRQGAEARRRRRERRRARGRSPARPRLPRGPRRPRGGRAAARAGRSARPGPPTPWSGIPAPGTAAATSTPEAWRRFLCVEAACRRRRDHARRPWRRRWRGSQTLPAVRSTSSKAPSTAEEERLAAAREGKAPWRLWGPYLSERQWGTVREDYSADGTAWEYLPHDHARSRAYRWGEDGIARHLRRPAAALLRARAVERRRPDPQGADVRADAATRAITART